MVRQRCRQYPEGSVKDCTRYRGPLEAWIAAEERFLEDAQRNFRLYGFDHESMFVSAIFPMIAAVQRSNEGDFFGDGLFVKYEERGPEQSFPFDGESSHHSGWRLLRAPKRAQGIVLLSRSNPNTCGIEILIEGDPPAEWVEEVIKTYYTARRTAVVVQAHYRAQLPPGLYP